MDHAKFAAGEAVLFAAGREGRKVDDDAEAFAEPLAHGSPPSISDPPAGP